jgi:hypothetical protein
MVLVAMLSVFDVHEMNADGTSRVCLSVRMFQLQNRVTNFDCIWYGHYAAGDYHKLILFYLLQSVMPT